MHRPALTAFEHQRIPTGSHGISGSELNFLLAVAEQRPGFCERGLDHVRLAHYCGLISLGDRSLEILPKTEESAGDTQCRAMLVRLLSYAVALPISRHLRAGQDTVRAPLLEVFISAFLDSVADVVRAGLMARYEERDKDLPVIRGAIQVNRQLTRNANRPERIACVYDDLTTNNEWNRLLRFGLSLVRSLIRDSALQGRWIELAAAFTDAEPSTLASESIRRLHLTRQAERYRSAVDWIRLFAEFVSPNIRAGSAQAPGLLFDMNQLFERAIANIMSACAPRGTDVRAQEGDKVLTSLADDASRSINKVKPDLVIRRNGKVVAIGDTKWKRLALGKSGVLEPDEHDVYQMIAYAAAYKCENLALIYPWHSGLIGSVETRLEVAALGERRPTISVICFDLASSTLRVVRGGDAMEWTSLLRATA